MLAAVRRGSVSDYLGSTAALVGLSVPHFWLGLMLIVIFSVGLGILPASGFVAFAADPIENLRHMVLPAIVLGTGFAAVMMRQTRAAMLESLGGRLHPHGARQGAERAGRSSGARPAQQPDDRGHRCSACSSAC